MTNWIQNVAEPRCLILAWQAPDAMQDRFRWAVGRVEPRADGEWTFVYLRPGSEFEALNQGRSYAELEALGFSGYPAFNLKRQVHGEGVARVFLRRLPPEGRADFTEYCRQFRIPPGLAVSRLALLGITEAKLPGDGFSLVNPLDSRVDRCELMLELAGFRYYAAHVAARLNIGDPVTFRPEPDNPHDPNAVMACVDGEKIGYINRLQAAAFRTWIDERRVSAVFERLNGRSDHPRAHVFVRVRPAAIRAAA